RMCCSLRCANGEAVRVAAFWNLCLLQFDMAHCFADEGRSIGRFAIWPRCWTGGKNRTMGLDLGSCSCLPSPFDLGPTIAGVLDLAKGLFFICSSCYCSDRLRDGFHAAWNGFCLDSALKPAGLFGCRWPRRTRKLLAGRWVLNRQDLMTIDGRLGHETLDQRDGCSNGVGHGWKLQCCPVARGCVRDLGKKRCCRVCRWVAC
ncbi:hypothetical protein ACLOJK_014536, partial [Asimina triloba]